MLNTAQNVFLVVLWVSLSIVYLLLLNRFWPANRRKAHNDVIGWQISIIGTIYAVMIGFMLYAVWANFQSAETNVNGEANALINIYRTADGLPAAQRSAIQKASVNYAEAVLTHEWNTMRDAGTAHAAQPFMMQLWAVMTQTPTQNFSQQVNLHQCMAELSKMTEHRRIRILQSGSAMPTILWAVLVMGGLITVASCGLIGSENVTLHFALIFALSLLISLALVAVGDIDQPFRGSVHVAPNAFIRAQETMLQPGLVPPELP